MNVCQTDVKYAIELFTRACLRGSSTYMQFDATAVQEYHDDDHYDSDEEWAPSDQGDGVEMEIDHELDDEFHMVDESDNEAAMECDENEEAWLVKPTNYATPLFDTTYPVL